MRSLLVAVCFCLSPINVRAADPERDHFFETRIRTLLVDHCHDCHGAKKQEGDLRLDRREFAFREHLGQAAVVAGDLEKSRLWQVIQYAEDDIQMPPTGKLSAEQLETLREWIADGAYWPQTEPADGEEAGGLPRLADGSIDFVAAAARHWSFRPVAQPEIPAVARPELCENAIDRFVLRDLESAGLSFSPPADRRTLIRRLSLDLRGVPPEIAEVRDFLADTRPDAVEQLIERYLADPKYGQRWGRFWLDVARYADTKGYVFQENRFYPYSYTYRDYVIRALNEDRPYDQFLLEQLAADQLGFAENDPRLAGMGFLTVGSRYLNAAPDIIDDRIDVVTRGLMGLTVGCARCHDHKYDPVPTADYYALYGVFNSSYEPPEPPQIGEIDEQDPGYQAFAAELANREQAVAEFISSSHNSLLQQAVDHAADYLPAVAQKLDLIAAEPAVEWKHGLPRARLIEHWTNHVLAQLQADRPEFRVWSALMALSDAQLAESPAAALAALESVAGAPAPLVAGFRESPPQSRLDVARRYGELFAAVGAEWRQLREEQPDATALPDAGRDALRQLLYGDGSLTALPAQERSPLFERDQHEGLRNIKAKVDEWKSSSPNAPARGMVLLDAAQPNEPVIFLRGDSRRPGPAVTRHFPRILSGGAEQAFQTGSGRLEMARRVVATDNPLTARVLVNRVWMQHFGEGLVSTPSDFGLRGDPPSHPELLDHLAWTLMHEDGWSLKSLHRRILLSRTYQQGSQDQPQAREIDPENRLLWRQNRQRLDFESLRDCLLAVSGALDPALDGRPVNIETEPYSHRRAVYALIDRNNPSALMRTFDFPSSDTSSAARPRTTVPQQSLFLMNSPFAQSAAALLAERVGSERDDPAGQAAALVERAFSRDATPAERDALVAFLQNGTLTELAQALLLTNEFLFVD